MSRRVLVSGGSRPRELVLVGTLTVGRDPTCDIHDAVDPLLSRRHAEIVSAKEVTVRDLGSRNGILVNGVKTKGCVLRGGDVVQIGQMQVKFVDQVGPFLDIPGSDAVQTFLTPAVPAGGPDADAATGVPDSPAVRAARFDSADDVTRKPGS